MAAFIQRLFKNRGKAAPQAPKTPAARPQETSPGADPTPAAPPQQETDRQRQQQQQTLDAGASQETLARLAVSGVTADIRLGALQALTEPAHLQQVQKAAKGRDKSVYQAARKALQAIRDEEQQQARTREALIATLRQARDLAGTGDTNLYGPRIETLVNQWARLEFAADSTQTTEFLSALHQCRQRLEAMAEEEQRDRRQQRQQHEREQTLSTLAESLEDLRRQPAAQPASLSSLDALQKTQENRWLEATRDTTVDKAEQKQYEASMQRLRGYITALQNFHHHEEALAQLLQEPGGDVQAAPEQCRQLLELIQWPQGFNPPALLQKAMDQAHIPAPATPEIREPDADQEQLAAELETVLGQLEASLEARQLRPSKQQFKQAQQLARRLDKRQRGHFQHRLQRLNAQLQELGDWHGFATQPKQIALCEQMEYLAEQPMDPEAKAEKIRELQGEWRGLGGSSDRSLWQRFREASQAAYAPCREYFSAKSGLKQTNLETRRAICDQLSQFLEGADWDTVDWKAVEQIQRTAKGEWKAAWPVEFRDNRPLQKRFDELLQQLEAPLNDERQRNEARKQDIVQRAQALVDHDPLSEAMAQAKQLQQDWQAIGITRHREDRKLWKAFRAACDGIFGRRDDARQQEAEQNQAADAAARELLEQADNLLASADTGDRSPPLIAALGEAATTAVSDNLREQLHQRQQQLRQARQQRQQAARTEQWKQWVRERVDGTLNPEELPPKWQQVPAGGATPSARELVVQAEILSAINSPEKDRELRMEVQVRRLAQGLSSATSDRQGEFNLESLVALWCLALPAGELDEALAGRLQAALDAGPA